MKVDVNMNVSALSAFVIVFYHCRFGLVCCHFDGRYDHSVTHSLLLLVLLVILVCVTLHCSLDIAPRHMAL